MLGLSIVMSMALVLIRLLGLCLIKCTVRLLLVELVVVILLSLILVFIGYLRLVRLSSSLISELALLASILPILPMILIHIQLLLLPQIDFLLPLPLRFVILKLIFKCSILIVELKELLSIFRVVFQDLIVILSKLNEIVAEYLKEIIRVFLVVRKYFIKKIFMR